MTTLNNCIYKSITLVNGEQFVLPQGASIVSISDSGNVSSTCEIPTLEGISCFVFYILLGEDGGGTETMDRVWIHGIKIDNEEYLFSTDLLIDNAVIALSGVTIPLNNFLQNKGISGLFQDLCTMITIDYSRGTAIAISFKTPQSLGSKISLIMEGGNIVPTSGGGLPGSEKYIIPAVPYSDESRIPKCPCVNINE